MGPLGTQELIFIFILALLLFGPKKLPELGKTIGKAMTEFRRAQSELKATFDREMQNIERETGIKELAATSYQADSYNYDHSTYDSYYESAHDSTETTTTTHGASASLGAGAAPLQIEAAAGSIANGHLETGHEPPAAVSANGHSDSGSAAHAHDASASPENPVSTRPVNS